MAKFKMVLMHGSRHGEGTHYFEAADDLLTHSPMTVLRAAFDGMRAEVSAVDIGHLDYEIYSALNDKAKGVVSALGALIFEGGQHEPFTALVSVA